MVKGIYPPPNYSYLFHPIPAVLLLRFVHLWKDPLIGADLDVDAKAARLV